MKKIPYGRQNISEEDIQAVNSVLRSDFLTQGPRIEEFEKAFAEYIGVQYAVAVNNGTSALHLAAMAIGIAPGDKVITTPITFVASANCVRFCGGHVAFSDIDPETYLMDPSKLEDLLDQYPAGTFKGLIPVDFAGYPQDMERLKRIAESHRLWIIEDACHAPGGWYTDTTGKKQRCGNCAFSDLAIFSFHPVKHIATGEGGMVTTNDPELYRKMILLRSHGITKDEDLLIENHGGWYYEMQELSHNMRLTDFQAALGLSQLKRADENLQKRLAIAQRYDEAFRDSVIQIPSRTQNIGHAFHLYVVQVPDRLGFYNYLRENGIFSQVHYIPVHYMPYYKRFGWEKGNFPVAESYYDHCISLPMFPSLSKGDQDYVISKTLEYFNGY